MCLIISEITQQGSKISSAISIFDEYDFKIISMASVLQFFDAAERRRR